jgi:hypothetical protein
MRFRGVLACGGAILALAGPAWADSIHIFSYDPADPATREAAGPLTFTFRRGLLSNTVLNLRSTEATATALVHRADEHALGPGGLARLVGPSTRERDLYEVDHAQEGEALISAFCPGAGRAWMAFGRLKLNRDLTVRVMGAPAKGGPAKLCRTLKFTFHGEWRLPPGRPINPDDLETPRFPGV